MHRTCRLPPAPVASFFQNTKFQHTPTHKMRQMRHTQPPASSHKRTRTHDNFMHFLNLPWPPTC
jgi:hypothetical protein